MSNVFCNIYIMGLLIWSYSSIHWVDLIISDAQMGTEQWQLRFTLAMLIYLIVAFLPAVVAAVIHLKPISSKK